ncbi:hypothetical protein [Shewanella gelidii]|uniref:KfrA N-terminal DNA-binding domain-containing protein n=1 Tax=Shewanella gelidii TaxID=1642821 RepID=A0A917JLR9_9GAMM|nr:hypothetical protein [Shewanella gelidii]MCL1097299.1 hypothetical protein [Shewanella gelidii]GGI74019.1 hypothetical protein GCM10009332_09420 [Shewanella gelidii]
MSLIDKVLAAAKSIADEGKQPSLALIKARTANKIPMPILIQGLQTFRSLPEAERAKITLSVEPTEPTQELTLENLAERLAILEQQVKHLQDKNQHLEQQIDSLTPEENG